MSGSVLCAAIVGFLLAVVCGNVLLGQHDQNVVPVVYATNGCPSDRIVTLDSGIRACLVRVHK